MFKSVPLEILCSTASFLLKNLGGFGDGGLLSVTDPEPVDEHEPSVFTVLSSSITTNMWWRNFRLDALQAALLSVKLDSLERRLINVGLMRSTIIVSSLLLDLEINLCFHLRLITAGILGISSPSVYSDGRRG